MIQSYRTMTFFIPLLFYLILINSSAYAWQSSGYCSLGNEVQLQINICYHGINIKNMEEKFDHIVVGHETPHCPHDAVTLKDVQQYLTDLNKRTDRMPAVLFYAYDRDKEKLCSWLISPHDITGHVEPSVKNEAIQSFQQELMQAFDAKNRAEQYIGLHSGLPENIKHTKDESQKQLSKASRLLLPSSLQNALKGIDSLIVIPIYSFGEVPFNALLADVASVVIAPGLQVFKEPPRKAAGRFDNPIVAGLSAYPMDHLKPTLAAAEEAKEVATLFGVDPPDKFIEKNASRQKINEHISTGKPIGLIYISSHAISDSVNPLDGSAIFLSDGRWSARKIYETYSPKEGRQINGRPLVVLSACQTGLGKPFEAGTIGMARAWYAVGASNVVMSLWRIDGQQTKPLMTRFMALTKTMPVDKALQKAMKEYKEAGAELAIWAGFNMLGLPDEGLPTQHMK